MIASKAFSKEREIPDDEIMVELCACTSGKQCNGRDTEYDGEWIELAVKYDGAGSRKTDAGIRIKMALVMITILYNTRMA